MSGPRFVADQVTLEDRGHALLDRDLPHANAEPGHDTVYGSKSQILTNEHSDVVPQRRRLALVTTGRSHEGNDEDEDGEALHDHET